MPGSGPGGRRVLIVGAGAIGGTLGGLLARAGVDVVFLVRSGEAAARINTEGLTVRGVQGTFTVRPRAESSVEKLAGPFQCVMAAVKAYDLSAALRPVLSLVPESCPVLSLQNGICLEELEGLVGPDRAVGCVVGWGATLHGSNEVELTSEAEMVIGCRSAAGRARLDGVRGLLSEALQVTIAADIIAELYSKLIINSCITTLGALSGRTLGWMLGRRVYRRAFTGIIREAMAAAAAAGIRVPPYAGRLDYEAFLRGEGVAGDMRRYVVLRVMGAKYRRLKSSSLQSLERGRPTEVDYFNGYIVRTARKHGIAAPLNERLTGMVHEIEAGKRAIGPHNVSGDLTAQRRS
jgi:2-dehydropantoate 2-reductase